MMMELFVQRRCCEMMLLLMLHYSSLMKERIL
jgi:hypothetical protein